MRFNNIFADILSRLSFIESEIIQGDEDLIKKAIGESKENKGYLEEIMRKKDHVLHPEVEKVLSALSNILDLPYQIYNMAKLADMDFPGFLVDGKEYPLSFVLFEEDWEYEADGKLRHAAFKNFSNKLREYQHTIATAYQTQVQKEKTLASLRGFDSVIDSLLFEQKVDRDLYNRQIDLIMEHLAPHMRKYAKLLQKIHGLEEMTFADLKLDLDPDFESKISVEEGREYIEGALSVLGDDYLDMVKRAFEERWIDFVQNKGKSTGAFCSTPYGSHPFILISWTGRMREVFTLAHELGYAGHFYLAHQNQNIFDTEPSFYFIEAPSTMNEMLMANYLTENIHDPGMKRWVLSSIIGRTYYHNFVTHLLEAHFQREVYKVIDTGGSLQASLLNQLKRETLEKFWGDTVKINEGAELTWMRQPHYYMGLYPYTYSTGLTIATEVSKRILAESQKAVDDWREVLKNLEYPLSLGNLIRELMVILTFSNTNNYPSAYLKHKEKRLWSELEDRLLSLLHESVLLFPGQKRIVRDCVGESKSLEDFYNSLKEKLFVEIFEKHYILYPVFPFEMTHNNIKEIVENIIIAFLNDDYCLC